MKCAVVRCLTMSKNVPHAQQTNLCVFTKSTKVKNVIGKRHFFFFQFFQQKQIFQLENGTFPNFSNFRPPPTRFYDMTFRTDGWCRMGGVGCRMGWMQKKSSRNGCEPRANLAKQLRTLRSGCEPREVAANLAKWLRTSRSGWDPWGGPHRRCTTLDVRLMIFKGRVRLSDVRL